MLKNQSEPYFACHLCCLKQCGTAFIASIEIDDKCEETHFPVFSAERGVRMPREALAWRPQNGFLKDEQDQRIAFEESHDRAA